MNARIMVAGKSRPGLFQKALGQHFDALPFTVQALHSVKERHHWAGEAQVSRGSSFIASLICSIIGFPPENANTPVSIVIERVGETEIWHRKFSNKKFRSVLTGSKMPANGLIKERFGLFQFDIQLEPSDSALCFPVVRGRFLGLTLPKWLLPRSKSCEREENDTFVFDVDIALPGLGPLVHYRGWLRPFPQQAQP